MDPEEVGGLQHRGRSLSLTQRAAICRMVCSGRRGVILLTTLAMVFAVLACPQPASAWRYRGAFNPGTYVVYPWNPAPWGLFPGERLPIAPRYSLPPGAPLSYSDPPGSGTTYCWSQSTGFYYVCGYSPSAPSPVGSISPMPLGFAPPLGDQTVRPASGVFLFKLPQDAEATVDGVPIGLSEGLGITAVAPGRHRVILQLSGKEIEHTVNVGPHGIFTITPSSIVPTEP